MKIFVAKLPYQFKEAEIAELFAPYGDVSSVNLIMDRETGRSKCYAFVEMPNDQQADAAINALNETQILDKAIAVSQAKERERSERPAGGGFRSGGGGGAGGYRGGNNSGGNSTGGNYRDSGNSGYRSGGDRGNYRDKGNSGGGNYRDRGNGGNYRDYKSKGESEDY